MLASNLFTDVRVIEAEFVAAVVANRHRRRSQADDFDVVRVTTFASSRVTRFVMGMIAPVHGDQCRSYDRVRAIWTHAPSSVSARRIVSRNTQTVNK